MKELKFICPSCGQHIQCDWKHAGENVPCPSCAALIRVPPDGDLTDVPSPPAANNPFQPVSGDAETVSYTPTKSADDPEQKKFTAPAEGAVSTPSPPSPVNPILPAVSDEKSPAIAHATHASELHCICPVCQSELRISVEPEPFLGGASHTAGLESGASESAKASPQKSAERLPMDERERQIAAARENALHPTTAKPRLDRILAG